MTYFKILCGVSLDGLRKNNIKPQDISFPVDITKCKRFNLDIRIMPRSNRTDREVKLQIFLALALD